MGVPASAPEPASLSLLVAGLTCLGIVSRRRLWPAHNGLQKLLTTYKTKIGLVGKLLPRIT